MLAKSPQMLKHSRLAAGVATWVNKIFFFLLYEENQGENRIGGTGRVSLMPTTTHVRAGSHF
jgi:hypothetical protein